MLHRDLRAQAAFCVPRLQMESPSCHLVISVGHLRILRQRRRGVSRLRTLPPPTCRDACPESLAGSVDTVPRGRIFAPSPRPRGTLPVLLTGPKLPNSSDACHICGRATQRAVRALYSLPPLSLPLRHLHECFLVCEGITGG